jgi:hypothetical protein
MLGPITKELFDQVMNQVKHPETQAKMEEHLIDPMIAYLHSKVRPYLQFLGLLMGIIIFLLILSIFINLKR